MNKNIWTRLLLDKFKTFVRVEPLNNSSNNNVDAVAWINRHEPKRIQYENDIEEVLLKKNIVVKRVKDELLTEPILFLTKAHQTPYKVFTPFYKRLRHELNITDSVETISDQQWQTCSSPVIQNKDSGFERLSLLTDHHWYNKLSAHWIPGENSASEKLTRLISHTLENYGIDRDFPSLAGTSSPVHVIVLLT